jgi:hypothetical protein
MMMRPGHIAEIIERMRINHHRSGSRMCLFSLSLSLSVCTLPACLVSTGRANPSTPEALHATFLLNELFEFNDWVWI